MTNSVPPINIIHLLLEEGISLSIGLSWPTHPSRFHVSQQHYARGLSINVGFEGDSLIPTTAHSDHGLQKEWKVLQAGEML